MNYIPEPIRDIAYQSGQNAAALLYKVRDLRNDTEFFEKVGQAASYCIQLLMLSYPGAASLSRLHVALQTVLLHDAYTFLKKPWEWIYPVNAEMIEENEILANLIEVLQDQIDQIDPNQLSVPADVEELARECLEHRLGAMRRSDDAYRSVDVFKDVLERQICETDDPIFDLANVDLTDLDVPLRHVPLLERVTNWNWAVVDLGCVGFFLHEWKLIDTAKWAESIGQVPGFQWIRSQSLETWVIALVCTGFTVRLVEAARKLQDEALTEEDSRVARWQIITSIFEFSFYGAIYLNRIGQSSIQNSTIQWLGIVAKAFGLVYIASRPAHQFFQDQVAPAA